MPLLTKINRVKNLAVFSDFKWDSKLEPFKRFNLIFGWNGSGKTALSRLFDSLGTGKHPSFPLLEYQVTIDGDQLSHAESISTPIKVFNKDYIDRNIKILEGKTNPILVVGEKSQEALAQIQSDETLLNGVAGDPKNPGKLALRTQAIRDMELLDEEISKEFSAIAKTIGAASSTGAATRNYRRPDAVAAFDKLTKKEVLSKADLDDCQQTLKQSPEPQLNKLEAITISIGKKPTKLENALGQLTARTNEALKTQVQIVAVERLREYADLAAWVEEGLQIHHKHKSKGCEFCLQPLPAARVKALEEHFNDADKNLKLTIEELLADIKTASSALADIGVHDEAKLYKSHRAAYTQAVATFKDAKAKLKSKLTALASHLEAKRVRTTEALVSDVVLDYAELDATILEINTQLQNHNEMTANLEKNQIGARKKIEHHYLSTIRDAVQEMRGKIAGLKKAIEFANKGDPDTEGDIGIEGLQKRISVNRAKVSSAHKSCDQLNDALRAYFGRDDLAYRVETDAAGAAIGYSLWRGTEVARLVSEGELTAIAFAHFTTRLAEQGFSVKDGIVVVDDPISSLDSAVLYRICAAIQKHLTAAGQLFVLTHNMEFFNHMKKWFRNDPAIRGDGNEEEKDANYRLLMIQSLYDGKLLRRVAVIAELDPMLRDHETEYHYLFKKLDSFETENPPGQPLTMQSIYDYPNLTRKLLECFLAFRVPKRGTMYTRMLGLRDLSDKISTEDISYVYNFINSNSHLDTKTGLLEFDTTLGIAGPAAIKKAMSLIDAADHEHFKAMQKASKKV